MDAVQGHREDPLAMIYQPEEPTGTGKLPKMTESALAAIEVAFISKTKVYRSLNMGVLQGRRARPGLNPPSVSKNIEKHWLY